MTVTEVKDMPRRILVVDDDDENRNLIVEILQGEGGYVMETAANGTDALAKIENWKPELVLLDYNMPGFSGLETLQHLRRKEIYVAVIFVSGNVDQNAVIDCLVAGADDYIRKPFQFRELIARVKVRFRNKDVQDQLEAASRRLRELAERDDVTGLYNMRFIYEKIEHELRRAKRFGRRVGCVMMDLDHFKSVNDEFDHLFGTHVLRDIGGIVKKHIREVDFAARYGGDEFLMVLTETDEKGTRTFAEKVRVDVEKHVSTDGKNRFSRTASLGFVVSDPKLDLGAKELVRRADHALYEAKETGRNKVVGYRPELDSRPDRPVNEIEDAQRARKAMAGKRR